MLMQKNNNFGIMYATYLDNKGFERFSVAHELGHYFLPGHPEALLTNDVHSSRAGFTSSERHELEADHFAAGFLMPSFLFDQEINKHQSGMSAIKSLRAVCETSMMATAIRYAQRTPDPIAIVISEKHKIDYCFMSDEMKEISGLSWPRKGQALPSGSATLRFNGAENNILNRKEAEAETSFDDWFNCSVKASLYEEVLGLGNYKKTLTVLSAEDLSDDDDEDLEESWTPRFRR